MPAAESPTCLNLDRLIHEYALKDHLDGAWAARPLELVREPGRTILVLEDHDATPLDRLVGRPIEIGTFLHVAVAAAGALGRLPESVASFTRTSSRAMCWSIRPAGSG